MQLLDERRSAVFALGFVAVVTGVLLANWSGAQPDGQRPNGG